MDAAFRLQTYFSQQTPWDRTRIVTCEDTLLTTSRGLGEVGDASRYEPT
jgi:hypothetical protein